MDHEGVTGMITLSAVSHGHDALLVGLLEDVSSCEEVTSVILTQNIAANDLDVPAGLEDRLAIIRNESPRGFGANHNAAFQYCKTDTFCVINPDVRLKGNPFGALLDCLEAGNCALIAPAVENPGGDLEDSARRFPTPSGLVAKLLGIADGRYPADRFRGDPFTVDWVAGMFMLFRSGSFHAVGGFDERYFLYYEDVDICTRLWRADERVCVCPDIRVIHDARRDSRRNMRYLRWHLTSVVRYFSRYMGRLPRAGV